MAIGSSKETETVGHTERMRLREGVRLREERTIGKRGNEGGLLTGLR